MVSMDGATYIATLLKNFCNFLDRSVDSAVPSSSSFSCDISSSDFPFDSDTKNVNNTSKQLIPARISRVFFTPIPGGYPSSVFARSGCRRDPVESRSEPRGENLSRDDESRRVGPEVREEEGEGEPAPAVEGFRAEIIIRERERRERGE
ncbi:hypothetical protein U1Q18_048586 [Sarracenia purpurea var. burkii]